MRSVKPISLIIAVILGFVFVSFAESQGQYAFGPEDSKITGSIRYTLIGKYSAHFEDFTGTIYFDENKIDKSHVTLNIKTASLKSRFPTLDRIVKSKRLLFVDEYPDITFKSTIISKKNSRYEVIGTLNLHGVSKEIYFPFSLEGPMEDDSGRKYLTARGTWVISRKDFGIIWHKLLDHSGIIVGNHITVDWEVVGFLRPPGAAK